MNIQLVNPRKSLNKAFLKQKPLQSEIELFVATLGYQVVKLVYRIYELGEAHLGVIVSKKYRLINILTL